MNNKSASPFSKEDFQKLLPYLISFGVMLVLLLVYFRPILEGKEFFQYDIFQSEGMRAEVDEYRENEDKQILWTSRMFSGMPTYQISTKYPGNWTGTLKYALTLGLPHPVGLLLWTFVGFMILMGVLRVNRWVGAMGAFAYTFSSYFFIALEAGHNTKILALAMVPPLIASIILTFRGKYVLGGALTALFTSLMLTVNHFQITYYFLFVIFAMSTAWAIKLLMDGKGKQLGIAVGTLAIAGLIGLGPSISQLWTTYEYSKLTIRGKSELTEKATGEARSGGLDLGYAYRWSYGVGETFTVLIPNLYGGASQQSLSSSSETVSLVKKRYGPQAAKQIQKAYPTYWGDQPFTSGPVYIGALVIFLFFLSFFYVDKRTLAWAIPITLLTIMFAWGKNFLGFNEFMFHNFPMFNKFRAPAMWLVVAEFTMPLLAFWGLSRFLQKKNELQASEEDLLKPLYIAGGITAGLLLLFIAGGSAFFSFSGANDAQTIGGMFGLKGNDPLLSELLEALEADRLSLMRMDALRSLAFVLLGAGALWLYVKGKIKQNMLLPALALLLVVDLWGVNTRYLNDESFVKPRDNAKRDEPTAIDKQIMADPDPHYRVLNLAANTFNDARTSKFHKSVGGYHAAKIRRYQDMIDYHTTGQVNPAILNMLNTKYVIQKNPQSGQEMVTRNPGALGNAWFVNQIKWVANPDEEIQAIGTFEPANTAVIDESKWKETVGSFQPSADSTASIRLTLFEPDYLVYESKSSKPGIAVFSEVFYDKGWNAYIDGEPVPHYRVNWILRGLNVPAGNHNIEFRFEPVSYYTGEKISLTFSIILVLVVIGGVGFEIKKRMTPTQDQGDQQEEE